MERCLSISSVLFRPLVMTSSWTKALPDLLMAPFIDLNKAKIFKIYPQVDPVPWKFFRIQLKLRWNLSLSKRV